MLDLFAKLFSQWECSLKHFLHIHFVTLFNSRTWYDCSYTSIKGHQNMKTHKKIYSSFAMMILRALSQIYCHIIKYKWQPFLFFHKQTECTHVSSLSSTARTTTSPDTGCDVLLYRHKDLNRQINFLLHLNYNHRLFNHTFFQILSICETNSSFPPLDQILRADLGVHDQNRLFITEVAITFPWERWSVSVDSLKERTQRTFTSFWINISTATFCLDNCTQRILLCLKMSLKQSNTPSPPP